MIHALAQVIALIGSIVRIPLILSGLSQLEFSAILICLQFLGMSGLIFGASRLFSRNPPVRFQTSEFTVDVQTMAKEILSISGWLFGLGFLNSQLFLLLFFPRGDYGLFLSVILMLLSTSLFGFSAYFGTLTGILDSRNKYNGVAFSDVASTILMIPLTYWAVNSNANPWIYLAIGSLTLFNMGIYAIVKLRHERIFHRIKFKLSFTDFKGVSGRMGQGLGAFLSNNFDLVIIGKFGNQVDAIEYSATSRINLAIDLPSAANAPKQWSQIAKLTETDAGFPSNLRKINFRFTFGNLVLVSPIAGAIFLLYEPYMQSLFGENYIPNYLLLGTVLVARIIYTTYSTLYLSLSTSSRVHMFTRLGIYIGLLNIALSCFAVKILPLIGAALGTTIASLIGIVVILFVNRRRPSNKKSSP
jgi:O-antigen/teichoic acid export membrane protein